jgi:hypothetical protein
MREMAMLDLETVDLTELCDALSSHFDELSWWLDPASGEIRMHHAEADDETAGDLDEAGLIFIEPVRSHDAYRDMEDFVDRLPDGRAADLLSRAIAGRGAFRRFKDTLFEFPELRERWFAFENARMRRRAIEWLADHELVSDADAERGLAQHSDPPVQPPPAAPATSAVRVERGGPVATVVLSRPEARNAVDGPTARRRDPRLAARRVSAGLPAPRPRVTARAARPGRARGDGQRAGARRSR